MQGTKVDPLSEEQPGRILHEVRAGLDAQATLGGRVYYGTADATPLFVMLLGELRRWGLDEGDVETLLPHADRALQWIEDYGDRDGDGFVEYQRATDRGLLHQGWKDSFDAISYASGQLAEPRSHWPRCRLRLRRLPRPCPLRRESHEDSLAEHWTLKAWS